MGPPRLCDDRFQSWLRVWIPKKLLLRLICLFRVELGDKGRHSSTFFTYERKFEFSVLFRWLFFEPISKLNFLGWRKTRTFGAFAFLRCGYLTESFFKWQIFVLKWECRVDLWSSALGRTVHIEFYTLIRCDLSINDFFEGLPFFSWLAWLLAFFLNHLAAVLIIHTFIWSLFCQFSIWQWCFIGTDLDLLVRHDALWRGTAHVLVFFRGNKLGRRIRYWRRA